MKAGILSDTHDAHKNVLKAIDIFNERGVEYVFHAGDMVSPFTAKAFANLKNAKFIVVLGNCDGEKLYLKSTIDDFGGQLCPHIYTGEIEGRKIFMTHMPDILDEVVHGGRYDLVIYGHTHEQDIRKVGGTLIVNPGETTDWITGKSSIVIVTLDDMSYENIPL